MEGGQLRRPGQDEDGAIVVITALSLVAIESGYLIGYRAGLRLNITSFVCNNLIALVLLGVGTILYREAFTLRTGSGMVICAAGLLLLLR